MSKLNTRYLNIAVEIAALFTRGARMKVEHSDNTTSEFAVGALARVADHSGRYVAANVSTAITLVSHESRVVVMGGAGAARTFTLPNATGSGGVYRFMVGAVNTSNYLIKSARSADVMKGQVINTNSGSSGAARGWYPGATDDTITLNGTTTGGANVGDWIELVDSAPNTWIVNGVTTGTGTVATPFSDTVA